jgi:hypothetical protein
MQRGIARVGPPDATIFARPLPARCPPAVRNPRQLARSLAARQFRQLLTLMLECLGIRALRRFMQVAA